MRVLPTGTYLSRISRSNGRGRRTAIADTFENLAPARDIKLFNAWNWPTAEGMWAQDKFHPNDDAHSYIADNLWSSLHATNFI